MRCILTGLALAMTLLGGAVIPAHATEAVEAESGPSFSCDHPNDVEGVICRDANLSLQDRDMAQLYAAAKVDAVGYGPSGQIEVQRQWLTDRDGACGRGAWLTARMFASEADCLAFWYGQRLQELAVADLYTLHDKALAVLGRENPTVAPLYEAFYDYTTLDDAQARATAVETALTPSFRPAGQAGTVEIAAASDEGFAEYFVMTGVSAQLILPVPCAGLLRRPGLTAMLGQRFGGAIDGHVPNTDCETMLPSTPAMEPMEKAMWNAQAFCEGTIRFSLGRDYVMVRNAVRLHQPQYWRLWAAAASPEEAAFREGGSDLITAARGELATYYRDVFKIAPDAAASDAGKAIDTLVRDGFHTCETG